MYGYYGFGNVGDDLLLSSVISGLSRFAPDTRFIVRSLNPVANTLDERIQYVALEKIMARVAWPRWRRLVCYAWETWLSLRGCSHLVFGGGTLFHARKGSSVNLGLIAMLVVMARLRGARVFALGVGVASLPQGTPKRLMEIILILAQDFAVRDASSLANCQHLCGVSRVRRTADLVFGLSLAETPRIPGNQPVLGITLAASDVGNDGLGNEAFLGNLASALACLQGRGWDIRLLSFQEVDVDGIKVSDSSLFAILHRYGFRPAAETIRVSSHPAEIARQFKDIDVIAGMRFHGHVLSALMGIPFVGFGRDSKLADLCVHFSMPFLAMSDFQSEHLVKAVEQARGQAPNRETTLSLSNAAAENFYSIEASIS